MTMEAPGTGGKLNEGAVKEHVVEGEGVFKPAPEWNEKPSSDRTRS